MKPGQKDIYKCYQCGAGVVVHMADRGTMPNFCDCIAGGCEGLMHRDYNSIDAMGRTPTHELYRPDDQPGSKLSIRKINKSEEES